MRCTVSCADPYAGSRYSPEHVNISLGETKYVVNTCSWGFFIAISGLGLLLSPVYANVARVVRNESLPNKNEGTVAFMSFTIIIVRIICWPNGSNLTLSGHCPRTVKSLSE